MKRFMRFEIKDKAFYGEVVGDRIKSINSIYEERYIYGLEYNLAEVKILPPVMPGKIIGAGLNYKSMAKAKGAEYPKEPILFLKPPSSIITTGDAIVIPSKVKEPLYEVELAVIIGKKAKNITPDKIGEYILGYTLANDVTAKDYMIQGEPWTKAKSFDTFTPIGPYIVKGVEPESITIQAYVNKEEKQNCNTSDMIFNVFQMASFISTIMTLNPGDLIITGTPYGNGKIKPGDLVECSSPELGVLVNPVIAG